IGDEIERLRDQKQKLLLEDAQNIALQQQVEYLGSFLDKQEGGITEYDEALVRKLIEKITVYDDRLVFEFKSGLEIEVKM
ncbi:MAG: recombinase family protein, partial [Oscillospiraceae bacterium]|nr:recombinase family protein [Oscillospiraceae bacterium]